MQESVRKEQKRSQTPLTWPTSLEMLRNPLITTYLKVRRRTEGGALNHWKRTAFR